MAKFIVSNDEVYYEYDGVAGYIIRDYATPDGIEAYLDDESFDEMIKSRYKDIDLSGENERDLDRFIRRRNRTAEWLRKQVAKYHKSG